MLMNGTNGNEPGYPEKALVPYPVIFSEKYNNESGSIDTAPSHERSRS